MKTFQMFDTDNNGMLTEQGMWKAIARLGFENIITKEKAKEIFEQCKPNEKGQVSFDELYDAISNKVDSDVKSSFLQVANSVTTPAERILKSLQKIKREYLLDDEEMSAEIDYAI